MTKELILQEEQYIFLPFFTTWTDICIFFVCILTFFFCDVHVKALASSAMGMIFL